MDRNKAESLLKSAIDPNTAPAALAELRDLIEEDTKAIETLSADNVNKGEQIKSLQADNVKLFLQGGKSAPADPEPEKDAFQIFEETITNALKGDK